MLKFKCKKKFTHRTVFFGKSLYDTVFRKGKIYEGRLDMDHPNHYIINRDKDEAYRFWNGEGERMNGSLLLDEYFYTERELRKLKIIKIL